MKRGLLVAAAAAVLVVGPAHAAASVALQPMTMIGDSVASSILYTPQAQELLFHGNRVDLELAPCRRLTTQSCPGVGGVAPPNLLQLVQSMGRRVGPTVVVAVGYNDWPQVYGPGIDRVLSELHSLGVRHVLWLTLRASSHGYLAMNDQIRAAAARTPWMTVVDWNKYSRSHPEWFQKDGIHLVGKGAYAMATLVHRWLIRLGLNGPVQRHLAVATAQLPEATVGIPYSARLRAIGGRKPYRWRTLDPPPPGLVIQRNGTVAGTATGDAQSYVLSVQVEDARGRFATRAVTLDVVRG